MANADSNDRKSKAPVASSVGPYEVSDELRPRIDKFGLWDAVEQLREEGYAVIRQAAPPELMDDLREVIHAVTKLTEPKSDTSAVKLLGRDPAVDLVATLPKVMALAEYSIGKGFRAGRFHGSIKRDGDGGLQLHSDQSWIPAPFPEHNLLVTFCFACEGMTEEGGATIVVPRSHLLRRHPTEAEIAESPTVAIEVEKGDVAVWDGATWHGAGSRSIPGTRTMLHATYQRLYTQPIDDFTHLLEDEEYLANAPDGMLDLLGTDLFFGTGSLNVDIDMEKFARTAAKSRL